MMFETDYTYDSGINTYVDVTRQGLGARGIDLLEKYTDSNQQTLLGFPVYDGHGNMVATLFRDSQTGGYTVADQRLYGAWGEIRGGATNGDPKGQYVANLGHVQDDESGLIYMRARYYEPSTGRFVSEDPARDGFNWVTYCGNDPLNYADHSGKAGDPLEFYHKALAFLFGPAAVQLTEAQIKAHILKIISKFEERSFRHLARAAALEAEAAVAGAAGAVEAARALQAAGAKQRAYAVVYELGILQLRTLQWLIEHDDL